MAERKRTSPVRETNNRKMLKGQQRNAPVRLSRKPTPMGNPEEMKPTLTRGDRVRSVRSA